MFLISAEKSQFSAKTRPFYEVISVDTHSTETQLLSRTLKKFHSH